MKFPELKISSGWSPIYLVSVMETKDQLDERLTHINGQMYKLEDYVSGIDMSENGAIDELRTALHILQKVCEYKEDIKCKMHKFEEAPKNNKVIPDGGFGSRID